MDYFVKKSRTLGIDNPLGSWLTSEELRWWMEATAEWAQPQVYGQDGEYPRWLDSLLANPHLSMVQCSVTEGPRAYGSFIFATFLEQIVANQNPIIIRQTWERYDTNPTADMLGAMEDVLVLLGDFILLGDFALLRT